MQLLRHAGGRCAAWGAPGTRAAAKPAICPAVNQLSTNRQTSSTSVSFWATCHPGMEQVVAGELRGLGAVDVAPGKAGVAFSGSSLSAGYSANLRLRSCIRVMVLMAEEELDTDVDGGRRAGQALYDMVRSSCDWAELIPAGATFSVEPRLWSCTDLNSTALVWTRVKDAICDALMDARNQRPPPPASGEVADVPLFVALYQDRASIYRVMSGASLHRRGYRDVMHKASLNEAAAAGILHLAGWDDACEQPDAMLVDPMCGSGTFLIEAALMARRVAPGLMRAPSAWPFVRWPDHEPQVWRDVLEQAAADVRPWEGVLLGMDAHEGALSLAERGAKRAGVADLIKWKQGDCRDWTLLRPPTMLVTNPPWGSRLMGGQTANEDSSGGRYQDGQRSSWQPKPRSSPGRGRQWSVDGRMGNEPDIEQSELQEAWTSLDRFLYTQCAGASAHVLSGNREALSWLRLKTSRKHPLTLSGVDARVFSYDIRGTAAQQSAQNDAAASPDALTAAAV